MAKNVFILQRSQILLQILPENCEEQNTFGNAKYLEIFKFNQDG